jgi:two-component system cell cycle response regulator CtrA
MTLCPHCFVDSATLAAQSERINVLEQEKAHLLELLAGSNEKPPNIPGLSPTEQKILGSLMRNERMTREAIMAVTQSTADQKVVDVYICRIRKKIAPLGLSIKNIWGEGYFIPREDKEALKAAA